MSAPPTQPHMPDLDVATFRDYALAHPPDADGRFGGFGGRFVPETLMPALLELERNINDAVADDAFVAEWLARLRSFVGRPTPLTYAAGLSELVGAEVYLKREDLAHTGAHKINNTLGQGLLCRRMGKTEVIAETGAGQHGVATATAAAYLGLRCRVFMGEADMARQQLNVFRMQLLGAQVVPVRSGTRTLKDATNEALRAWVTRVTDTHYILGSAVGPHPFPWMVRIFQSVVGVEARLQCAEQDLVPDYVVACVGGGSNSIAVMHPFRDTAAELVGVEAAGEGLDARHGASLAKGVPGVLHGSLSYLLTSAHGQIAEAHSVSAGLDYPGVGPELAHLKHSGRMQTAAVTDAEALAALQELCRREGLIPALESAHAIAWLLRRPWPPGRRPVVLLNLSGRGDKDVAEVARHLGTEV